jgi:hypothetical protein
VTNRTAEPSLGTGAVWYPEASATGQRVRGQARDQTAWVARRSGTVGDGTLVVQVAGGFITWTYDPTYQLTNEQRSGANASSVPPAPRDAPSGGAPFTWEEPQFWKQTRPKNFVYGGLRFLNQIWNCCETPTTEYWWTHPEDPSDPPVLPYPVGPEP